jgi:2,4-dienoyl-CoA reductase-like NADH-dependent reductase (Old Yellow Enzyme family)
MLEQPFTFPCGLAVRNRIAKASMTERLAEPDGTPSDKLFRLYETFGRGGAGLLLSGNVAVDPHHLEGHGNMTAEFLDGTAFATLARRAQGSGARMLLQLNHPGRQAMRSVDSAPVAPSAVALQAKRFFSAPRAMTEQEITQLIANFAEAAARAERAGFAGVEIHAAHGYLLSQFLSPNTNQRTDRWGGDVTGRARLLLQVIAAVRERVSPRFAVGVKLNAGDFVAGGLDLKDVATVARLVSNESIDFIELSGGTFERPASFGYGLAQSTARREGYFLDMARVLREATTLPLVVTGGFRSRDGMESALAEGACDLVGMARPLALMPDLPSRLIDGTLQAGTSANLRLPKGPAASLAELSWYREQLLAISRGGRPRTGGNGSLALLRTLLRDRWLQHKHTKYRSQRAYLSAVAQADVARR